TRTSSAGSTPSSHGRRCGAGAWSTASPASRRASCTSATTPATSRRRRRTRLRAHRRPLVPKPPNFPLAGLDPAKGAFGGGFAVTSAGDGPPRAGSLKGGAVMSEDAQGHRLSGAPAASVADYDQAVRAFNLVHGDSIGLFDAARAASP